MTHIRRHRPGSPRSCSPPSATLLVLFALDTRAWQATVRRDDMRFRALPDHGDLWKPATILPGDPAGAAARHGRHDRVAPGAADLLVHHIGANPQSQQDLPKLRAQAQQQLHDLTSSARTAAERSNAANLLGVLVDHDADLGRQRDGADPDPQAVDRYFQQAIASRPAATTDAKQNLELVLRVTRPGKGPFGKDARARFRLRPRSRRDADRKRLLMLAALRPLVPHAARRAVRARRRRYRSRRSSPRSGGRRGSAPCSSCRAAAAARSCRSRSRSSLLPRSSRSPLRSRSSCGSSWCSERADAQAFFVFDTSDSMEAAARAAAQPTRLAAREAARAAVCSATLADVPVGIASMTDRVAAGPHADDRSGAVRRARSLQSVGIDHPPPSQAYHRGRATNFQALVPVVSSHFFSQRSRRRLLVVFTDGEASQDMELFGLGIGHTLKPVFVHVWASGEHIYHHGRADPFYEADPTSAQLLQHAADLSSGTVVDENKFGALKAAAHRAVGNGTSVAHVDAYARISLAPWFALGGILPLGFLFYRRNF